MSDAAEFLQTIDKSGFTIKPYAKRVEKPWGYELHLTPESSPYMAKILHINEGCRLSLQAHDEKSESWCVLRGTAAVMIEDTEGELKQVELEVDKGYTSALGQRHRLVGITDCDVFEASTPEIGTTWRLEDDYARPDETEAMRQDPNRGWKGQIS